MALYSGVKIAVKHLVPPTWNSCRVRTFSPSERPINLPDHQDGPPPRAEPDDENLSVGGWSVSKKQCTVVSFLVGAATTILGLALLLSIFPNLIAENVKDNMDLRNPRSEGYKNFIAPPFPVYTKFNVYRIMNANQVVSGEEYPRFEEIGPYSFKEHREKINVTPMGNTHVRFGQFRNFTFDPATSCYNCTDTDLVPFLNVAMVGIIQMLQQVPGGDSLIPVMERAILTDPKYRDRMFLEVPMREILFDGFPLNSLNYVLDMINIFPLLTKIFNFNFKHPAYSRSGFAIYKGRHNSAFHEWYTINTGTINQTKYYQTEEWGPYDGEEFYKNLNPLNWWKKNGGFRGSNVCNHIRGTDGQQFHPDIREHERLYVFNTDTCASFFLEFEEHTTLQGIPVMKFVTTERTLKVNTVYNLGFCSQYKPHINFDKCAKLSEDDPELLDLSECNLSKSDCPDGIRLLTACQGAPLIMSFPHFLYGPQKFNDIVNLTRAVKEKHEVAIYVEPTTGTSLAVYQRLQVNWILEKNKLFGPLKRVKKAMYPLLWFETTAVVDAASARKMRKLVVAQKQTLATVQWLFIGGGVFAMIASSVYGVGKFVI